MLYPLKFRPRLKKRIWGGRLLSERLGKRVPKDSVVGESWEISGVDGDISIVSNGPLAGNNLEELIEVYMGELVGDRVYEKFGLEFPLLIKYIDAQDKLSVQVHPDDELAAERHVDHGKTEMWYILETVPDAELYIGFKEKLSAEIYNAHVSAHTLPQALSTIRVNPGEAFFIPAGTVHSIGKGVLLAEIQQTSDITYRIYDWDRKDAQGRARELHMELAADAIHFEENGPYALPIKSKKNEAAVLKKCPYFTTNLLDLDGEMELNYVALDSFVIYMPFEEALTVEWDEGSEHFRRGETILLPACIEEVRLKGKGKILEIYIE